MQVLILNKNLDIHLWGPEKRSRPETEFGGHLWGGGDGSHAHQRDSWEKIERKKNEEKGAQDPALRNAVACNGSLEKRDAAKRKKPQPRWRQQSKRGGILECSGRRQEPVVSDTEVKKMWTETRSFMTIVSFVGGAWGQKPDSVEGKGRPQV